MKKYKVYVHTCPNGKRYVGCTTQKVNERWHGGRSYSGIFQQDILKYGWDNITHEVFEVDSKEEMYRKEIELISFYHSNDPRYGYNHSVGGEKSALGCIRSEEYRKHLSEVNKKRYSDHPEIRRKISETQKGKPKPHSEDHKRKISEAVKKRWSDPEYRRKLSEAQKNRPRIKIQLPDGTILEMTKHNLARNYINKGRKFEYLSY